MMLLRAIAAGPARPTAALIEADCIAGTQNNAAAVGTATSTTQLPWPQSAFVAQVPAAGSSTQYDPSGDATPLRSMLPSKHARSRSTQTPASCAAQSSLSRHGQVRRVQTTAALLGGVVAALRVTAAARSRLFRARRSGWYSRYPVAAELRRNLAHRSHPGRTRRPDCTASSDLHRKSHSGNRYRKPPAARAQRRKPRSCHSRRWSHTLSSGSRCSVDNRRCSSMARACPGTPHRRCPDAARRDCLRRGSRHPACGFRVVTCVRRIVSSVPVASIGSGGQSSDVPPKVGLTAPTVHASPSRGPPSQTNVSPTSGVSASAPQRGHGFSVCIPRPGRNRTATEMSPVPVAVSTSPVRSPSKYAVTHKGIGRSQAVTEARAISRRFARSDNHCPPRTRYPSTGNNACR